MEEVDKELDEQVSRDRGLSATANNTGSQHVRAAPTNANSTNIALASHDGIEGSGGGEGEGRRVWVGGTARAATRAETDEANVQPIELQLDRVRADVRRRDPVALHAFERRFTQLAEGTSANAGVSAAWAWLAEDAREERERRERLSTSTRRGNVDTTLM